MYGHCRYIWPVETKLSKWGNSLAIRIPAAMAKDAGLAEGDQLELKLNKPVELFSGQPAHGTSYSPSLSTTAIYFKFLYNCR